MAQTTRSKDWFYKQCILEVENAGPLSDLSWRALLIGIAQLHGTRGHMNQAIGAVDDFLAANPQYLPLLQGAPTNVSFDLTTAANAAVQTGWVNWFAGMTGDNPGAFGHDFGYNFDTLRGLLTPALGGARAGGGGGDDEFKTVLRLMGDFHSRG